MLPEHLLVFIQLYGPAVGGLKVSNIADIEVSIIIGLNQFHRVVFNNGIHQYLFPGGGKVGINMNEVSRETAVIVNAILENAVYITPTHIAAVAVNDKLKNCCITDFAPFPEQVAGRIQQHHPGIGIPVILRMTIIKMLLPSRVGAGNEVASVLQDRKSVV